MNKITPCVHSVQMQLDAANKRIAELEKALATSFEFLSFSQTADYWFYENHKHLLKEQGE